MQTKFCSTCGAALAAGHKFCPRCGAAVSAPVPPAGEALKPGQAHRGARATPVAVVLGVAIVGILVAASRLFSPVAAPATPLSPSQLPVIAPTSTQAALPPTAPPALTLPTGIPPTEPPVATLPPPLAAVEFPTQAIDYPGDWPAQLHYPRQFDLVEAISGELPGGGSTGWAAKLRYRGEPSSAADLLSSFFTSQGWQIAERMELDSGGFLLLVERDNKTGSGILIIDPDPVDRLYSRVVALVVPERPGQ